MTSIIIVKKMKYKTLFMISFIAFVGYYYSFTSTKNGTPSDLSYDVPPHYCTCFKVSSTQICQALTSPSWIPC